MRGNLLLVGSFRKRLGPLPLCQLSRQKGLRPPTEPEQVVGTCIEMVRWSNAWAVGGRPTGSSTSEDFRSPISSQLSCNRHKRMELSRLEEAMEEGHSIHSSSSSSKDSTAGHQTREGEE